MSARKKDRAAQKQAAKEKRITERYQRYARCIGHDELGCVIEEVRFDNGSTIHVGPPQKTRGFRPEGGSA
jgi:hypothetical protein